MHSTKTNKQTKIKQAPEYKFSRCSFGVRTEAANVLTPISSPFPPSIPLFCCLHVVFSISIPSPASLCDLLLLRSFHPLFHGSLQADQPHGERFGCTKLHAQPVALLFPPVLELKAAWVLPLRGVHQAMTWVSISLPCTQDIYCQMT